MAAALLDNLIVSRKGKPLLGPISHQFASTGATILIGPNGSGKTTLLKALHGITPIKQGRRIWKGKDKNTMSYVFQTPIILRRSVHANLTYPLEIAGARPQHIKGLVDEWATKTGLAQNLSRAAIHLSGGEKQKLALARALITNPDILFLDEPCANLDGQSTLEIERLLFLAIRSGTRIYMATHDLGQARRLADDIALLNKGKIVASGPAGPFFKDPQNAIAKAFIDGELLT